MCGRSIELTLVNFTSPSDPLMNRKPRFTLFVNVHSFFFHFMTIILFLTEEKIVSPASIPEYAAVILETARKQIVCRTKGTTVKEKKKADPKKFSLPEMIDIARKNEQPSTYDADIEENVPTTREVILEAELDLANRELKGLEGELQ